MMWARAILVVVTLTGCAEYSAPNNDPARSETSSAQEETASTDDVRAGDERNNADNPPKPEPELDAEAFAKRLEEDFYRDSPADLESVSVSNRGEVDFILDNLAHLPKLKEIEFSAVDYGESDFGKMAPFPNIAQLEFEDYVAVDISGLSSLRSVTGLKFARCESIPWEDICRCDLRHLEIYKSPVGAVGLRSLADLETLESVSFSEVDGLDDDDLADLAQVKSLQSLAVYNCRNVKGDFLAQLKGLGEFREFKFTGPLTVERSLHLAGFANLRTIELNSKQPLPPDWYRAIAENCRKLKRLVLFYQALDKAKIDHLSSLAELTDLEVYSDGQIRDMSFGGPQVKAEPGALESLGRLKKLEILHLSRGYSLNAADGAAITSLANLERLALWYVKFEPGALKDLGRLTELAELSIYQGRGLGTADAEGIGALTNLEELDLCEFRKETDADFSHLKGLSKLRELDLSGFRNLSNADMAMAQGMGSLEKLTLERSAAVSDKGIAQWRHATKLRSLWMQKMYIDGTGFQEWPADHGIESIFIEGTAIGNEGLKAMSRLRNLGDLEIRIIRLFGGDIEVDVSCFADTPSLASVSLMGSYVTTQEAIDKLLTAHPDMGVACRIKE
jgi:hypothetical protein